MSEYTTRRRAFLQRLATLCAERGCPRCALKGPRCHHCGKKAPSWIALEVDHLFGKGWEANRVNSWQRLRLMERELTVNLEKRNEAGLVTSCGHCNQSRGSQVRYRWNSRRRRRGGRRLSNYAVDYARYLADKQEREDYRERAEAERDQFAGELGAPPGGEADQAGGDAPHRAEGGELQPGGEVRDGARVAGDPGEGGRSPGDGGDPPF